MWVAPIPGAGILGCIKWKNQAEYQRARIHHSLLPDSRCDIMDNLLSSCSCTIPIIVDYNVDL